MARLTSIATLSSLCIIAGMAAAQEAETPQQEAATGIVITAASDGTAIRVLNSAPLNGAFFLPMMGGGLNASSHWLHDPQVQKELGLLAEQMDKIKDLRSTAAKKQSEMLKAMREVTPEKRGEFLAEMQQVLRDDLEKQIKQVLLPHQAQRLEEVSMQMHMNRSGTRALRSKKLAEALGLTDKQQKALRKKQAEIQKRLTEQIAKLKKEAQEELIGVLSPKQQKKLEEMLGKKFDHKPGGSTIAPGILQGLPKSLVPKTLLRKSR